MLVTASAIVRGWEYEGIILVETNRLTYNLLLTQALCQKTFSNLNGSRGDNCQSIITLCRTNQEIKLTQEEHLSIEEMLMVLIWECYRFQGDLPDYGYATNKYREVLSMQTTTSWIVADNIEPCPEVFNHPKFRA